MDALSKKVPIKTVARVRPCFNGTNQSSLIIDSIKSTIIVNSKNKEYHLDNVFDENATPETLYETIAQPIVDEVLGGKNGTIFAYGQTGSGKTYTMNGNKVNGKTRGIIVRSIDSIFEYLNARLKNDPQFKFSLKCSYIEVYKKRAFDLLQTDGATVNILSSGEQIIIEGAAEFVVTSIEECLRHLQNGWKNRKTAKTSMNRESSRSHAIFMLTLVTEEINGTFVNLRTSCLNFVDLAGSERQSQTNNTGERLKEAGCINQDLLFLSTVIRIKSTAKEGAFIQYRNCSLTHLLRDSLGGNSITAVIVTIHQNLEFVNDTDSTLNFAKNCKKVKNEAKVNEAVSTKDVEEWKAEIQRAKEDKSSLMEEIQQLKEEKEQMEKRQRENEDRILKLQNEKKTLKAEVENATRKLELMEFEKHENVLLVESLCYSNGEWSVWDPGYKIFGISFEHSGFQISPQWELFLANHQNLSSVVNRITCSNLKVLKLFEITIPFSDYKKWTGNKIFLLRLVDVIVNDENGIKVGIDKLWNVEYLSHKFTDNESVHEMAQKLVELEPFPNLLSLGLLNVQDGFDLQAFYQFLKKNTKVSCTLKCSKKSLKQMKETHKKMPQLPTGRHFHIVEYK
uniref:Kinesin motor domain-containing protein n=1 Tax=Panagrolaimus davidi TaxID=227884 RepID=A0A914RAL5_9BILA